MVELLVATVILGICAGSVVSVSTSNFQRSSLAAERLAALSVAESEIAKIRATARTTALNPGIQLTSAPANTPRPMNLSKTITKVAGYSDLYKINISLSWTDATSKGHSRTLKMVTLVRAPYG